jgi:hypothetical protein
MYVGMGLRKNEHGVWVVRIRCLSIFKRPSRALNNGKDRQAYPQKSSGTKDRAEAKRVL